MVSVGHLTMGATMAESRKRRQSIPPPSEQQQRRQQQTMMRSSNRDSKWLVRDRVFAFHGVTPARCAQWTRLLQARGAIFAPSWRAAVKQHTGADRIYVVTDYWVDMAPPPAQQLAIVTEFWLAEVLKSGSYVAPQTNPFFTPPPFTGPALLSYPQEYQTSLVSDADGGTPVYKVAMPCSPLNLHEDAVPLWPYIVAYLRQPTRDVRELSAVIQRINGEDRYRLNCLQLAIDTLLSDAERRAFFDDVLPTMKQRVLDLPFRFAASVRLLPPLATPVSTSKQQTSDSLELSRDELLSLLSGLFLCVFPGQRHVPKTDFPWFSMEQMMTAPRSMPDFVELKAHKIRTILEYFLRVVPRASSPSLAAQRVTFTRVALAIPGITPSLPSSSSSSPTRRSPPPPIETDPLLVLQALHGDATAPLPLCTVRVETATLIEDLARHVQIDFANKYAGGGVMNGGCVQEEIRFLLSPELLVACLVFARLEANESFVVHGTERFSEYTGYGGTYRFNGTHQDPTTTKSDRIHSVVVGIDAISYGANASRQYTRRCVLRDLVKATVGFAYADADSLDWPIATGNWGCGVFRGDAELKFLLQWLAASLVKRSELVYVIFEKGGDLEAKIQRLLAACGKVATPHRLAEWLMEFVWGLERSAKGDGRPPSVLAKAAAFIVAKSHSSTASGGGHASSPLPAPGPATSSSSSSSPPPAPVQAGSSHGDRSPPPARTRPDTGKPQLKQPKLTSFWK